MADETWSEVGREIDRGYLHYSEVLAGIAGATIGLIATFVLNTDVEGVKHPNLLFVSLFALGATILFSFFVFFLYLVVLKHNWLYVQAEEGRFLDKDEQNSHKDIQKKLKPYIRRCLYLQLVAFIIGVIFLFISMFIKFYP